MKRLLDKLWQLVLVLSLLALTLSLLGVLWVRYLPAPYTLTMLGRQQEKANPKPLTEQRTWVSLDEMSPHLVTAVQAAEDQNYMAHDGFDFDAIALAEAYNKTAKGPKRGASTISQQTAKNVFCWQERSWLRKGLETYFTTLIEYAWPKRRIMEVYLNVIEMGPEVFGVETYARTYYKKSAKQMGIYPSALLAACLPNPRQWTPKLAPSYVQQRQQAIAGQMPYMPTDLAKPTELRNFH